MPGYSRARPAATAVDVRGSLQRLSASRAAPLAGLLSGALMPLAYAPFQQWWLAPLCLGLLFALVLATPGRRGLWTAYAFGYSYFGLGCYWVFNSIELQAGALVALPVTLVLAAFFALFPLAALALGRRLSPGPGWGAVVVMPAAWVAVEWVRSWLLTGMPWLTVGYTQTDSWLAGLAPVSGVFGLSLAVSLAAGLLAAVLLRFTPRRLAVLAAGWLLIAVAPAVLDRPWTEPTGEPLDVALVQGNIAQAVKWKPEQRQPTLDRYRRLTATAWGADLVIWPETALPDYTLRLRDYLDTLRRTAQRHGTELLYGAPVYVREEGRAYNSLVSLTGERYDKRHLVPFGEYVPLRDFFGRALDFLGAPMSDFALGDGSGLMTVQGVPSAISICYEAIFGAEVIQALPEAQLLINVSNDAWFGDSLAPYQHLQMARLRAIETGRWLLRATNTGITVVADHRGEIRAALPMFEVGTLRAQVQPRTGATPYVRWGDWPVVILCLLALVAAGLVSRGSRR